MVAFNSIYTNPAAYTALQSLNKINRNLDISQNRVASGLRVASALDDASSFQIAQGLRGEIAAIDAVQTTIENRGYKPIANLTGHGIKRYNLHSGISVPNVKENGGAVLKPGDIIAIEPFVTDGAGRVGGKRNSNIYHVRQIRNIRDEKAAKMIDEIQNRYKGLPFAERWLHRIQKNDATNSLTKLMRSGIVSYYPILDELGKGMVAQSEHTLSLIHISEPTRLLSSAEAG